MPNASCSTLAPKTSNNNFNLITETREVSLKGRLSTVDLLVLTSSD
jgi:hypothetical protein